MSSPFDKNLLPGFDSVKDKDEEIIWAEKPKFIPYLFSGLGVGLYMLGFSALWITTTINVKPEDGGSSYFWMFGILPLAQGLVTVGKKLFSYSNTLYAFSDKRIMMRSGFIGTDFKTIDYDKVSDIEVRVNVIERIYGVGTIQFFSGRTQTEENVTTKLYDKWESIPDPYGVFKKVKEVMVDIKTDYNYPNALRPGTNPGYKTKYDRK